ncbi:hypothetical protein SprV_0100203500 [Sparganum proliferum]
MENEIKNLKTEMEKLTKLPRHSHVKRKPATSDPQKTNGKYSSTVSLTGSAAKEEDSPSKEEITTENRPLLQEKNDREGSQETQKRPRASRKEKAGPNVRMSVQSPHAMPANTTLPKDVSHDQEDSVGEEPCGSYAMTGVSESSDDDNGDWRNADRASKNKHRGSLPNRHLYRKRNIVIKGAPESDSSTAKERIEHDLNLFQTYSNAILQDGECVTVHKAFRLGNADASRGLPRPLKIILANEAQASHLLEGRMALRHSHKEVFFQPDYEPTERHKMRELWTELKRRTEEGEKGLKIKEGKIIQIKRSFLWLTPFVIRAGTLREDGH